MKFIIEYPVVSAPGAGWLEPANITRFARAVEEAGLDGIGFTDHPAPSLKWLNGGGHETLDPFAALGFCAAVTTRIRLLTWLSVVPYRNPFLAAKSMTTVSSRWPRSGRRVPWRAPVMTLLPGMGRS
jgi:alkanesulfonate monooxygenase SsuD/methylene tetrahydromethanopterin reductase-like flavin-dependent oxidoreductase (luciferase family)